MTAGSSTAPLSVDIALISDRGGRAYNEDACGHWRSASQLCCVLADGAGGHGGGEIASRLSVQGLIERFAGTPSQAAAELKDLLRDTNEALRARREPGTPTQDMHSTVVSLVIDLISHRAHWAHVGDSRLYWLREGAVLHRTSDHSLVQSLVDAGMLDEAGRNLHPRRSELHSALGLPSEDLLISADDARLSVQPGDVFLLCTDGFWEYLDDAFLLRTQALAADAQSWLAMLGEQVSRTAAHKSSHDNFSALAVWLGEA